MEIIRRNTDYALRGLIYLVSEGKGRISGQELAKHCGIPRSFAYKILKQLTRAGLLESQAGRTGGFRLARKPRAIRLITVIEVMQGPVHVRKCLLDSRTCPRHPQCLLSKKWGKLQQQVVKFFHDTSIQDILHG